MTTAELAPPPERIAIGSLFSGIDGLALGVETALAENGYAPETVFQVEMDNYATKILEKRWPHAARFRDVRTVGGRGHGGDGGELRFPRTRADGLIIEHELPAIDVLVAGFPCQDLSYAGKGAGLAGARSGLWYEVDRIIGEVRPRIVVLENVRALLGRGLREVLGCLAAERYDAWWGVVSAASVGAPHLRERVFVVAWDRDATGDRTAVAERLRRVVAAITPPRDLAWPTPRAIYGEHSGMRDPSHLTGAVQVSWPTPTATLAKLSTAPPSEYHRHTPNLAVAARLADVHGWPTPVAGINANNTRKLTPSHMDGSHGLVLSAVVHELCETTTAFNLSLSPDWVDCLMGFPVGFTDLSVDGTARELSAEWHGWPARPGPTQHPWEPPRVVPRGSPSRVGRLKCLGNSVVRQCSEVVGHVVAEVLRWGRT